MKINEAEKRTAISAHNIRFYEKEHLIRPTRNPLNDYREYSEEDIELLNQIKFLRMLGIPVKDIRECLEEKKKLSDVLNHHLINLKDETDRVKQNLIICQQLIDEEISIGDLSENLIEQVFSDKQAYIYYLEKVKKQDRIQNFFFISKHIFCIIGGFIALILLSCIIKIIYYNEKNY